MDLIKFNNSGDSFCFPRMAAYDNPMTDAEVAAICEIANNIGKRLAAHAHADRGGVGVGSRRHAG